MSSYFAGKRILLTGASGYLATNLTHTLKNVGCTIVRLSRCSELLPVNGIAKILDISGNICEREVWGEALENVDIVYHFAAQTSVYAADENPLADLKINVLPMLNLLKTCRNMGRQPVIIFSGTVTEVGIPKSLPVNETHEDCPITIYDLHKLMAENYLKYYSQQGIVKGTILRLPNVYGPGPKSSSADRGILNMMIQRALRGEDLTLYGKGDNLRDYIYVKDVINAFLVAGIKIDVLNGCHFVIGSGIGHTLKEAFESVVERVKIITGRTVNVVRVKPPQAQSPIDTRDFVADVTAFKSLTNWEPNYTLQSGIDNTIDYFNN
nr:NAD-dependent epimerase/dehydratase family protein [Bacteroidota bacterium]